MPGRLDFLSSFLALPFTHRPRRSSPPRPEDCIGEASKAYILRSRDARGEETTKQRSSPRQAWAPVEVGIEDKSPRVPSLLSLQPPSPRGKWHPSPNTLAQRQGCWERGVTLPLRDPKPESCTSSLVGPGSDRAHARNSRNSLAMSRSHSVPARCLLVFEHRCPSGADLLEDQATHPAAARFSVDSRFGLEE